MNRAQQIGGASCGAIAQYLNDRGVPPPGGGKQWYSSSVQRIARNALNKGVLYWGVESAPDTPPVPHTQSSVTGREPIRHDHFIDPLIPPAEFDRVQAILDGKQALWTRRRASRPQYLLTGKLCCTHCKRLMYGMRQRSGKTMRVYYRHHQYRDHDDDRCAWSGRSVRAELMDELVLAQVGNLLADGQLDLLIQSHLERLTSAESIDAFAAERARLTEHVKQWKRQLKKATEAYTRSDSPVVQDSFQLQIDTLGRQIDIGIADLDALDKRDEEVQRLGREQAGFLADISSLREQIASQPMQRIIIEQVVDSVVFDFATATAEIIVRLAPSS